MGFFKIIILQIAEQENYKFENAKITINDNGEAEVRYFGQKELQNEQAAANVDKDLMARAQRFLAKELGEDALKNQKPDLLIPKPYYIDKQGNEHYLDWTINEDKTELSINFTPTKGEYPIALDPTLGFSLENKLSVNVVLTGGVTNNYFGNSIMAADLNADGKTDLAVGANGCNSNQGCTYIFYNGNLVTKNAAAADITLTGETINNYFSSSLTSADFNADGKTNLAVGADGYNSSTGRVYMYINEIKKDTETSAVNNTPILFKSGVRLKSNTGLK